MRSGTSVGAQYREAVRGRSDAEFVSKMESCLQELDETSYWLELIVDIGTFKKELIQPLIQDSNELIAIFL